MEFAPQPPTAGALGTELSKGKKRRHDGGGGGNVPSKVDIVSNQPTRSAVPPMYEEAPWAPGFNLAGRPDSLFRSEMGVQKQQTKVTGLFRQGSLNQDSYFHFVVKSDKYEWIRFLRDSVSLLIYGQVKNSAQKLPADAGYANASPEEKALWHALTARKGVPTVMVDPDVSGSGFFIASRSPLMEFPYLPTVRWAIYFYKASECNDCWEKIEKLQNIYVVHRKLLGLTAASTKP